MNAKLHYLRLFFLLVLMILFVLTFVILNCDYVNLDKSSNDDDDNNQTSSSSSTAAPDDIAGCWDATMTFDSQPSDPVEEKWMISQLIADIEIVLGTDIFVLSTCTGTVTGSQMDLDATLQTAYGGDELNLLGTITGDNISGNIKDETGDTIGTFTMSRFSTQSALLMLQLSTATITADGDSSDWSSIIPIITDPSNDTENSGPAGSDILSCKLVMNSSRTMLYALYELNGTVDTSTDFTIRLANYDVTNDESLVTTQYIDFSPYYNDPDWYYTYGESGGSPAITVVPANNCIEFAIDLSDDRLDDQGFDSTAYFNVYLEFRGPSDIDYDEAQTFGTIYKF